eukprot:m.69170 g.69170  ORF g.69170 m.69170 type:complete len:192 (+) comp12217_c1_seq1:161-736(+)
MKFTLSLLLVMALALVVLAGRRRKSVGRRTGFFKNPYERVFCNGRALHTFRAPIVDALNRIYDEDLTIDDYPKFTAENCTYAGSLEDDTYNVELAMDMQDAVYTAEDTYETAQPSFEVVELRGRIVSCDIGSAEGAIESDVTFACISKDQIKKHSVYKSRAKYLTNESKTFKPRTHGLKYAYPITVQEGTG